MSRILVPLYGAISYVVFLASFLYAVAWLGNFLVPKTIDSGAASPLGVAVLVNVLLLTVIGPVITIAVALHGMDRLGQRFDEVQNRADRRALALDLKFGVTDFNGWQTAYGYDDGASRPQFERSAQNVRRLLAVAHRTLTEPRERAILARLQSSFDAFMALDVVAYRALRAGQDRRVKQIFLGYADAERPDGAAWSGLCRTQRQQARHAGGNRGHCGLAQQLTAVGIEYVGSCLRCHVGSPWLWSVTPTEFEIDASVRREERLAQVLAISSLSVVRPR